MLDTNTKFTDKEIDDWNPDERYRLQVWKNDMQLWFDENQKVISLLGKYEYFGTFNFDEDWVKYRNFDELENSIKHFKSILRKKLFGRQGEFNMNIYPVIETKKFEKTFKTYVPVTPHVHILFGEVPDTVKLKKDFETTVIDCWMTLNESSGVRVGKRGQEVKKVWYVSFNRCSENYITKLRNDPDGVEFEDKKNFSKRKNPELFDDDDFLEWFDRNSKDILKTEPVMN